MVAGLVNGCGLARSGRGLLKEVQDADGRVDARLVEQRDDVAGFALLLN